MQIENIISRLDKVKKTGNSKYIARCPAHLDGRPSLTIAETGSKILVHCFAGCTAHDIVQSVGLKITDLFTDTQNPREQAKHKINQLNDEIQRMDTLIAIYDYDLSHNRITDSQKTKYRDLLKERIDLVNHQSNLKRKYGIH